MPASPSADSNRYVGGALILLLVGALAMAGVARSGSVGRDLPLLPPLGGGAAELSLLAANPPTSLDPGVVAPASDGPAYLLKARSAAEVAAALSAALGLCRRFGDELRRQRLCRGR